MGLSNMQRQGVPQFGGTNRESPVSSKLRFRVYLKHIIPTRYDPKLKLTKQNVKVDFKEHRVFQQFENILIILYEKMNK